MPLLACRLCGKIFNSIGGRTCQACHARLDDLYPRVREYLRDNAKMAFSVDSIAEAMEVEIRDIQGLVDLGYLDRDIGSQPDPEEARRQKLAKELESSLKQMKGEAAKSKGSTSYGQQRYGDKKG